MASPPERDPGLGQFPTAAPQQLNTTPPGNAPRQVYGRVAQGVSNDEAHFIPYRPHDVVYTSLRIMVFQVDPVSATPVAHKIREDLNDAEIYKLLENVYISPPTVRPKNIAKTHAQTPASTQTHRISNADALRKKMDEARIKHATDLRDQGMVDVNIIYKCDKYTIEPLKTDKEKLEATGARPYHLYTFREREQEMVLSVIATADALKAVFPLKRCRSFNIFIKTNTAPAASVAELARIEDAKPKITPETMFPYIQPDPSETAEQKMKRVIGEIEKRPRSESVLKVRHAAPSDCWYPFSSALRTDCPQPQWTAADAPFVKDPGSMENDGWWQEDWMKRMQMIEGWRQARNSGVGREDLVEPLCNTFTADRNDRWWEQNVQATFETNAMTEYKQAEQRYNGEVCNAQRFYQILADVSYIAGINPENDKRQEEMQELKRLQPGIRQQLAMAEALLLHRARKCGRVIDSSRLNIAEQGERKAWYAVTIRLQQHAEEQRRLRQISSAAAPSIERPSTPMPPQMLPTRTIAARRPCEPPAEAHDSARDLGTEQPAANDTIPFPEYVDPMLTQDMAATQQHINRPLPALAERRRTRRTNSARAIANVGVDAELQGQATEERTELQALSEEAHSQPTNMPSHQTSATNRNKGKAKAVEANSAVAPSVTDSSPSTASEDDGCAVVDDEYQVR